MASPAYNVKDSVTYQPVSMDDTVRLTGSARACFHTASVSQLHVSKPAGYKDHASQRVIFVRGLFFTKRTVRVYWFVFEYKHGMSVGRKLPFERLFPQEKLERCLVSFHPSQRTNLVLKYFFRKIHSQVV